MSTLLLGPWERTGRPLHDELGWAMVMVKEMIQVPMSALVFGFGQRSLEKVPFYILERGLRAVCFCIDGLRLALVDAFDHPGSQ